MLKENKRTLIITSIVTLLPILIGMILWEQLPEVMAIHFGVDNQADGFAGKAFAVIGLPLVLLAIEWIGVFATTHDPKKQNISRKMFAITLWIVPLLSLITTAMMYYYNLGYQTDVVWVSELIMGVVFTVIGNYLPKARQNYTIGIKIPWTLSDEDNWNRTHRLAGYLWMIGGIFLIIGALTGFVKINLVLVIILLMILVPCIYSGVLYNRRKVS